MINTIITLAVMALLLLYTIGVYNHLVALRNRYRNAFAQIHVQLQRRHDLIPNLVETAKRYLQHEEDTLTRVIQARQQAVQAQGKAQQSPDNSALLSQLSQTENNLSQALMRFHAVAENYPELKANTTMVELMEELSSTENRISFARQAFNDGVMQYNTYREQFPQNLVASVGGFTEATLLTLENPDAKQAVKVNFN